MISKHKSNKSYPRTFVMGEELIFKLFMHKVDILLIGVLGNDKIDRIPHSRFLIIALKSVKNGVHFIICSIFSKTTCPMISFILSVVSICIWCAFM